jgi:glycosyltransferase involved in cell wall biosynthesis
MENIVPKEMSPEQGVPGRQLPTKICMHVQGPARTDVRVMREATALVEAGFAVEIIDIVSDPSLPLEEEMSGVQVKHIIWPAWSVSTRFKLWFLVKAARMIVQSLVLLIRVQTDIYHAHDEGALPACSIAAWLRRKPLVFDAHELPFEQRVHKRWPRLQALAKRVIALIVPRCAGVITVSPPIVREITTQYHPKSIALVRNIPAYQYAVKGTRLHQALGLDPQVRVALYQGVLHSSRGLEYIVQAARFLAPGIIIALMGSGSKKTLADLESLIVSEGVIDRVKLLPAVPYGELLTWTASADLGLIVYDPSDSLNVLMCLPNKLFEYVMAGVPVLASQLPAVGEILTTYEVGRIVASLTPQAVGEGINSLLTDEAALALMHENALQAAQQELCWEHERAHLLLLYSRVVAEHIQYRKIQHHSAF